MSFFDIIIAPFLYFIEQVYHFAFGLTNNHGVSIILLSFAVSLLLLPIFILIEKTKKRNDAIRQRMKPVADEIKRCYKGQERYYYLKTLNRQHGYSPLKALVPILSLLVQIPFFIAAYQFLEGYPPLEGVSFLFINDLSAPDGLLGSVNILPIAMTVVNLLTAYFYTRNGNTAERKQMVVVAALFLILLFNLPSGLVLYWTMNNVFSFFRLFVTNPEVFRKVKKKTDSSALSTTNLKREPAPLQPWLLRMFIGLTTIAILVQLHWGFRHNFDDIVLRIILSIFSGAGITLLLFITVLLFRKQLAIKTRRYSATVFRNFIAEVKDFNLSAWLFLSLLFLTIYFYFGSRYYFDGIHHGLGVLAFILMLISQLMGLFFFIKNYNRFNKILAGIATAILFVLFCTQCLIFWTIHANEAVSFILKLGGYVLKGELIDVVVPGILFISIIAFFIPRKKSIRQPGKHSSYGSVYFLSILYLLGFIFLWNPLDIYSSYPAYFDFPAIEIIKQNIGIFSVAFIGLTAFYFFLPRKFRYSLLVVLASAVILGFIHNTIVPIDLGTLQDAVFLKQDNLAQPIFIYLLEGIGILCIVFGVNWLFKRKYQKQFCFALIALNIILIAQSLIIVGSSGSFFQKKNIPPDLSSSISLSKDKENIVLVVLDMFHGWYVNRAINEEPELKKSYKGFVWYPNTLSVSSITGSSIGAMLGGYKYTIDKLNQDENCTLEQKITNIASDFNSKIRSRGYRYSASHIIYSIHDSITYDTFLPKWHEDWNTFNSKLNIGIKKEVGFTLLWNNAALYTVPLIFKPIIYNQGQWLQGNIETNENTSRTMPYNFLRLLPHISDATSTQPNFLYLYSPATHHPWDRIEDDGSLQPDISPYENNKWALKTLSNWFEWMKENEVYDNTKIIVVSDHGPHWWWFDGDVDTDIPVVLNAKEKRINDASMGLFALMLVKDFNSHGDLKEDWRFMSNADVGAIIFDEDDPTKADPPLSRTLPSSEVVWVKKLWKLNQLHVSKQFEVTDNMYDLNNWKIVE